MGDLKGRGKLHFTIGLPRSGKSTYCEDWIKGELVDGPPLSRPYDTIFQMWHLLRPRVIVAGDKVRHALHGHAYLPEAEGHVFAAIDTMVSALLLTGFDVIIDETATTRATIRRYFKIDPEAVPVWINVDEDVCIQRAVDSGKAYLVEPIKRMARQLAKLKADYPHNFLRLQEYARMRQNHDIHV